ncbi:hypothetical protein [Mycobacterium angelicum]|uniref:hypothetical protein n=1 Tax=Mycobacterium angelicum TaxID=470074 RepID=UPI00111C6CC7|nr:hypothetical protein [Mycobacterium angelicum]MCV7199079.1 hypothetical protein [Mycobacterium angelicum]
MCAKPIDDICWLADNDYPLAPVEEVATKAKYPEEVDQQHLADAVKQSRTARVCPALGFWPHRPAAAVADHQRGLLAHQPHRRALSVKL